MSPENQEVADSNHEVPANGEATDNGESKKSEVSVKEKEKGSENLCPSSPAPQPQPTTYQQAYLPQLTPQAGAGYYLYQHSQVTPDQPSPVTPGYDVNSFLQHQALGVHPGLSSPFTTSQYGGLPQAPLSPGRAGMAGGTIPPASPLLPRPSGGVAGSFDQQNPLEGSVLQRVSAAGAPPSPSIPYMSPPLGPATATSFSGVYQGYVGGVSGTYGNGNNTNNNNNSNTNNSSSNGNSESTSQDDNAWSDRNKQQQQTYTQASPQLQAQGLPMQYARGNRTYSFDEMLPSSMLDHQDQSNPSFSPYSGSTSASSTYPHHQPTWAYGAAGDMYNPPQSPLQTRQAPMHAHYPGAAMGPAMHQMGHYGNHGGMSYYPATSPGPPIQTTPSNKGPDGANLFIFHIPNHFTNLDMYRLFCQYGNLLSVRIMVEKETGRSRGFGFVSYDSPESAALAIKELNGFAIGNKRLKVQHKQIRTNDQRNYNGGNSGSGYLRPDLPQLPPRTVGISATPWYHTQKPNPVVPNSQELASNGASAELEVKPDENGSGIGPPHVPGDKELSRSGNKSISPLATLEPLRNALPDVSGHTGTVE